MRRTLADVPPMEAAVANVQYALSESAAGDGVDARVDVDAAIKALGAMKVSDLEQLASALVAKSRIEIDQHDVANGCASARLALSLRPADDPATGWRHAEAQSVSTANVWRLSATTWRRATAAIGTSRPCSVFAAPTTG